MAVEYITPEYVQRDGTKVRIFVSDTEGEKPSQAADGSLVFVKESRAWYTRDAVGETWTSNATAPGPHDHDGVYEPVHTHPYSSDVHNHDGSYAPTHLHPYSLDSHTHAGSGGGTPPNHAIRYVSKSGSDSNDGLAWDSSKLTIAGAVASLPDAGGFRQGSVYIGPGTFIESQRLDFTNGIKYVGSGNAYGGGTIIQRANGMNDDLFGPAPGFTDYAHGVYMADLRLHGNMANNTSGSGVRIFNGGYQTEIHNVVVDRFNEYGFEFTRNAITACLYNIGATNNGLGAMFIDIGGSLMNLKVDGFQFDDNGPPDGAAITISHNNTSTGGGNVVQLLGCKAEAQSDGIQDKVIQFLPRTNPGGNSPLIIVDGLSASVVGSNTALCHEVNNAGVAARWKITGTNSVNYVNHFQSLKTGETRAGDALYGPAASGGGGQAFPVGSIFMSTVATNPATLLGYGTWTAFGAGRVPVGFDAGQAEFDTVEETGGSKTHTLTEAEMPAHTHVENQNSATTGGLAGWGARDTSTNTPIATSYSTGSTGGGGAHNNLQPYIVVFMWKRTA